MRTVSVKLLADVGNYTANLRKATAETKSLSGEIDKAAKGGKLDHVTDMATGLGLGMVGASAMVAKFAMDFEKQMSGVAAAAKGAGASASDIDALGKASLQAGKDTSFSATEAAKGVEELLKAGVSTADVLSGGLSGALDLAAAGEMDVGAAAETAASALTQFKLKGKDIPHVADLLAAGAGKAQGEVSDLGAALNQAGLIAAGTGLSIEETTGTLAAFASAGLIGSDAGTSFKTMLQAIQAPSGKTKLLMDDLGISAYDTAGQFVGIAKFAQNLKEKLSVLTPEVRANAMAQIFGSDATRAANILYEQGATGIQTWIDKTNDAGYAAEVAAIKTDNLSGDVERLKGSLETAAIESGGGLNKGLRLLTQAVGGLVDVAAKMPPVISGGILVLTALGGVLTLGLVAWVKARTAIASAVVELNAVGPAGARAAAGLQATTKWAGRAGIALAALAIADIVFDKFGNGAIEVDKLTESLQTYAETGKMTQGLTDSFGEDMEYFAKNARYASDATHGFTGTLAEMSGYIPGLDTLSEWTFGTSFSDSTERMQALDESLVSFIGTQKDAKKAGELWNDLLTKSGLNTEELAALLPGAWKGLQDLQKAAHSGAGAQGELAAESGKTTEQLEEERKAAEALQKAFEDLFDQYMSADKAAMDYQEALVATNEELRKGAKTLAVNSDEGRKNRQQVLALIDTIKDQRKANIDNGMSVADADKKYRSQIETLKKTMLHLGFTRDDVGKLINKYRDIPKTVGTSIETPGLPKASSGIKGYHKQLDNLARQIKTHVSVEGDAAAYKRLQRLLIAQQAATKGISVSAAASAFGKQEAKAFHTGGYTGNGGKYDVAGAVHGKEFVLKSEATSRIRNRHPGVLEEMNATGQLPGYAGGGLVMPFPVNASQTKIISMADALSKVATHFSKEWPSSPSAQRGDSGVWRKVVAMIKSTGPLSGSFGNAYRPGDPLWHGSGRAVDWMGYQQDALATYLSHQRPLELIHRTRKRDYAYTRGVNKGSFNNSLMNAHRNHIHIAMQHGGTIMEPVFGVGASGATYSFGEGGRHERVTPLGADGGGGTVINVNVQAGYVVSERDLENTIARTVSRLTTRGRA